LTFNECWQSEKQPGILTNTSSTNRLILVHAGSENGFIEKASLVFQAGKATGDYHGQMNYKNLQWTHTQLLPNLPNKNVVVMDNAPYHCSGKQTPNKVCS
jgi:hypothetical protein